MTKSLTEQAVNAIIRPPRKEYDLDSLPKTIPSEDGKSNYTRIPVTITLPRKETIVGSLYKENFMDETSGGSCVIYMHGNASSQLEGQFLVPNICPHEVFVFCFDFVGCGCSSGEYISLGMNETGDTEYVVNYLQKRFALGPFILWGRSMGAATALMVKNKSIKGVIADSAFVSLKELCTCIAIAQGVPSLFASTAIWYLQKKISQVMDIKFDDVSPLNSVKNSPPPILYGHAEFDEFIPFHHSEILYENTKNKIKQFEKLPGGHNDRRSADWIRKAVTFALQRLDISTENLVISECRNLQGANFHFGNYDQLIGDVATLEDESIAEAYDQAGGNLFKIDNVENMVFNVEEIDDMEEFNDIEFNINDAADQIDFVIVDPDAEPTTTDSGRKIPTIDEITQGGGIKKSPSKLGGGIRSSPSGKITLLGDGSGIRSSPSGKIALLGGNGIRNSPSGKISLLGGGNGICGSPSGKITLLGDGIRSSPSGRIALLGEGGGIKSSPSGRIALLGDGGGIKSSPSGKITLLGDGIRSSPSGRIALLGDGGGIKSSPSGRIALLGDGGGGIRSSPSGRITLLGDGIRPSPSKNFGDGIRSSPSGRITLLGEGNGIRSSPSKLLLEGGGGIKPSPSRQFALLRDDITPNGRIVLLTPEIPGNSNGGGGIRPSPSNQISFLPPNESPKGGGGIKSSPSRIILLNSSPPQNTDSIIAPSPGIRSYPSRNNSLLLNPSPRSPLLDGIQGIDANDSQAVIIPMENEKKDVKKKKSNTKSKSKPKSKKSVKKPKSPEESSDPANGRQQSPSKGNNKKPKDSSKKIAKCRSGTIRRPAEILKKKKKDDKEKEHKKTKISQGDQGMSLSRNNNLAQSFDFIDLYSAKSNHLDLMINKSPSKENMSTLFPKSAAEYNKHRK